MRVQIMGGEAEQAARIAGALARDGLTIAAPDAPFDLRITLGAVMPQRLQAGDVTIDLAARRAARGGRAVPLTPIEFAILAYLARTGRPVRRAELIREIWGYGFDPGTNLAAVHVSRLRDKIGRHIVTGGARGYSIADPAPS